MAPVGIVGRGSRFLSSLTGLYSTKAKELPPPISEQGAVLCSILFTILYVAPFYLSPTLRATPLSSRDAPSVIQARIRAVLFTCAACSALTVYILVDWAHASTTEILHLTGIWPLNVLDCVKVLSLVAILFVGPLYEHFIVDRKWRDVNINNMKDSLWSSWTGYRNLVVAPVTEELVFRSLVIPMFLIARVSASRIVFISPLVFGLAHVHHFVEFVNSHTLPGHSLPGANIWVKGAVRSLFQFTYTSLFGFFAAFVFLRTGSLWTVIPAHMFCNWMGFPRVWGRLGVDRVPAHTITPDVAQGKRDDEAVAKVGNAALLPDSDSWSASRPSAQTFLYTAVYYALLVVGAYGFKTMLWTLTESNNALVVFDTLHKKS